MTGSAAPGKSEPKAGSKSAGKHKRPGNVPIGTYATGALLPPGSKRRLSGGSDERALTLTSGVWVPPPPRIELTAYYLQDKNATVVELHIPGYGEPFTGSAKRIPGDKYDQEIGKFLALGRALTKAGKAIEKRELWMSEEIHYVG